MSPNTLNRNHFFIDGPNMDATLGFSVLGRKPLPTERARWNRVSDVARTRFGVDRSYFVLNGDKADSSCAGFYRFLRLNKFEVATPKRADWCTSDDRDPVDEYIKDRIESLIESNQRGELGGVLLAAHDGGYAPILARILGVGGFVGIVGFREWFAPELVALRASGAVLLDLEDDFGAFDSPLDRPDIAA